MSLDSTEHRNQNKHTKATKSVQDPTVKVSIKVQVWVMESSGLHGTGQLLLLHLAVEGAVCAVGEGRHAGLQAAVGPLSVRPPPPVLHG